MIPAPDVGPPIGVCRGCGDEKLHNNVFEFEETPLRGGGRSRKGLDRLFEAVAEASVEVFDPSTDTQGEPFDLDSGGALDPTFGADVIGAELDSSVGDASQGSPADDSNRGDVPDAAKAGPEPGLASSRHARGGSGGKTAKKRPRRFFANRLCRGTTQPALAHQSELTGRKAAGLEQYPWVLLT